MTLVSLFKKAKPAVPDVNRQPATFRHEQVDGATLHLARTYGARRPSDLEIRTCQRAIGWERLDGDGRWYAQQWFLALVARCGGERPGHDYARHVCADFPVDPEVEERHRRLRAQAEGAPRLHVQLAVERQQNQQLQEKLRGIEEERTRAVHDRDLFRDEREDARRNSLFYSGKLTQVMELISDVRPAPPSAVRQGRLGRSGTDARYSLPAGFHDWDEVQAAAVAGGYDAASDAATTPAQADPAEKVGATGDQPAA